MNQGLQASGHGPGEGGGPPGDGGYGPPGGTGFGPPGGGGGAPPNGPAWGPGAAQAQPMTGGPSGPSGGGPAKGGGKGLIIGIVVVALLAVGGVGAGVWLYMFSDVGKEASVAHEHLPNSCDIVVRADLAKVQALPAFQTHVKPALDELTDEATKVDDPDAADLKAFLIEARLNPSKDIAEAAICVADPTNKPKYLFILGGQFSAEGIVDAAARRGEDSEKVQLGGRSAVKSKSKKTGDTVWLTQAADGAILFANDEALLTAALERTDAHKSVYQLDITNELGFVATSGLMARQKGQLASNPLSKGLVDITGVTGSVGLAVPGGQVKLNTPGPSNAAAMEKELSGLLALVKLGLTKEAQPSKAGEMEALQQARVSVAGSQVVIDLPWTTAGVEQAMKLAGDAIREGQKKGLP